MSFKLKSVLIALVANAVSLAVADWIFDGMSVSPWWYVITVVVFTALNVAIGALVTVATPNLIRVSTIAGGLAVTFAALWVTDLLVTDAHFRIEGWGTWLGATALVWAAGIAYGEVDHHAPANTPGVSV